MTAGSVTAVVSERDGLDQGDVDRRGPGDRGRHLGDLEGVGQPGPLMVTGMHHDLGLPGQPAERGGVDDPVAIPLEAGPFPVGLLPRRHDARHRSRGWPQGRSQSRSRSSRRSRSNTGAGPTSAREPWWARTSAAGRVPRHRLGPLLRARRYLTHATATRRRSGRTPDRRPARDPDPPRRSPSGSCPVPGVRSPPRLLGPTDPRIRRPPAGAPPTDRDQGADRGRRRRRARCERCPWSRPWLVKTRRGVRATTPRCAASTHRGGLITGEASSSRSTNSGWVAASRAATTAPRDAPTSATRWCPFSSSCWATAATAASSSKPSFRPGRRPCSQGASTGRLSTHHVHHRLPGRRALTDAVQEHQGQRARASPQPPDTPISAAARSSSAPEVSASQPSGSATPARGEPCRPRGTPSSCRGNGHVGRELRQQAVELGERGDHGQRPAQLAADREALEVPGHVLAQVGQPAPLVPEGLTSSSACRRSMIATSPRSGSRR